MNREKLAAETQMSREKLAVEQQMKREAAAATVLAKAPGAAERLSALGRGGDSEIAHVTPGEIVLPQALQTPEVMAALQAAAAHAGADLGRFQVGNPASRVNPATGA